MASEGNWSIKVTCLPFLSVISLTFILTKSYISSTREFICVICSINCEIAPRIKSDADEGFFGVVKTHKRRSKKIYNSEFTMTNIQNQVKYKYRVDPQRTRLTLIEKLTWSNLG